MILFVAARVQHKLEDVIFNPVQHKLEDVIFNPALLICAIMNHLYTTNYTLNVTVLKRPIEFSFTSLQTIHNEFYLILRQQHTC